MVLAINDRNRNFFFLSCQVTVVRFYVSWPLRLLLLLPLLLLLLRIECSPPDLDCKRSQWSPWSPRASSGSEWSPGPQLQARDRTGPRRTLIATSWSKLSQPDLDHKECANVYQIERQNAKKEFRRYGRCKYIYIYIYIYLFIFVYIRCRMY